MLIKETIKEKNNPFNPFNPRFIEIPKQELSGPKGPRLRRCRSRRPFLPRPEAL